MPAVLSTARYAFAGQVALLLVALLVVRIFLRYRKFKPLQNIPGPPSGSFWTGNIAEFSSRHNAALQREVALNYGPVVRLSTFLGTPTLYISDPTALHHILIKEENVFQETDAFIASNYLIFGLGLPSTLGEHHRKQRKMLNPVFSVNHMRRLLPLFYNIIHKLRDAIAVEIGDEQREVDVLGWCGRTALELIGQGGLGYSFDPLTERVPNEYGDALKVLFPTTQYLDALRRLTPLVSNLGPAWFRRAVLDVIPSKRVQTVKKIVDTMDARSTEIYEAKKAAIREGDEKLLKQIGEGKDIMSVLMKANMVASEADKLPEHELIAQMTTLIFAATDTTSNTLACILELLATNPDVQTQLREELLSSGAAECLSYDELNKLPLLDGICRETLRVYPLVTLASRAPTQDALVPLGEPIIGLDGTIMKEVLIPKGVEVVIGTLGCNTNKSLWGEDALTWKPHRWLSTLPSAVSDAPIPGVYSNLMTFLGGKRACIGFKFSEMEMKVVLAVLVSNFVFELSDKPIRWNVAGVWYPSIGTEDNTPQMPLKVSRYTGPCA
ncbi:cytochrome P450 [Wolfiporia cocos MD-104 SS10]|uniref:Cytochrome P450 n=1 Tax=Wolfiporia cocos (strain MD-104) TaxID=742152 RepID=A0A2H3JWG2_WOLCO|nr:cytochrome P450 [Wolfiporia cocos MD-104 SS10]